MPAKSTYSYAGSLLICLVVYLIALAVAIVAGWMVKEEHPIIIVAVADIAATIVVFAASKWYNNSSIYDPYWSVAPMAIVVYWAWASDGAIYWRLWLASALVWLWAIRLTWNCFDRWAGLNEEDWRYRDLKEQHGKWYWLVSFSGIHLFPTVLVLLACLPLYPAVSIGSIGLGWLDIAAAVVLLAGIYFETRADWELRRFRNRKTKDNKLLNTGLWACCRYPNYLGEILFWWGVYLFGLAADTGWWWTIIGPLAITALFIFISIPLKDKRLIASKPEYADYIQHVPALLPNCLKNK